MKILKPLISLSLVALLSVGIGGPAQNSFAVEDPPLETAVAFKSEDLANLRVELSKYGVNNETIEKLTKKLKEQKPIDSMVYDVDKAVSYTKIETSNGYEAVYTFEDGSIIVTGVEDLDTLEESQANKPLSVQKFNKFTSKNIGTLGTGVKGGSCIGGSGYTSCNNVEVYYSNPGVWEMSFKANYSIAYGAYDSITWIGNWSIWQVGGTYSNPSLRYIKQREDGFGKAEARLSATLVLGSNYGTMTRSVSFLLGSDSATARGNTYY